MLPHARWTHDCQGKQDFDGPLLAVSTRYYPGPDGGGTMVISPGRPIWTVPYGPKPSPTSSIILRVGPAEEGDGGGDYYIWRRQDFEGETEADVKAQVERWVSAQMEDAVRLLGGKEAFKEP
jgi:hypothetical protein